MRCRLLLLGSSILLCFSSTGAVSRATEITLVKIEPLSLFNEETKIQLGIRASRTDVLSYTVSIYNDLYPDGEALFKGTANTTATKTFVYDNKLTSSSNEIGITWFTSTNKKKTTIKTNMDVFNPRTVRITDSQFEFTSECKYSSYLPTSGWKQANEKLVFENFGGQYVPDFYHRIDLSNFKVNCTQGFNTALAMNEAYLFITNINGVFDDLEQSGKNAMIPLGIEKIGFSYSLCFLNDMYVDQLSLRMSSSPKPGYVKTKYLYLPRNEKRNENEYEFNIKINDFGMERNNYIGSFRYKSLLNTLGDCHNSKYCVVNE